MPNFLKLTKLNSIHLVDKGAAVGSRVLVIKRAGSRAEEDPMSLEDKLAAAIAKSVTAVLKEESEGVGEKTPQQLLELALAKVPETERAAIMAAVAAMQMAPPPPAPVAPVKVEPEPEPEPPKPEPPKPEDASKRDKAFAAVLKAMKPEERAIVEAAIGQRDEEIEKRKDLSDRLETAEEEIAKGKAKGEMDEQLKIAKSFAHVPGDFKKRAGILLALKKSDEKAYDEMVKQLKSSEELLKKGKALKGRGTSRFDGDEGGDDHDGESAHEQLDRMARAIVEKSVEKGDSKPPTYEVAYARVVKLHPKLLVQAHREAQQIH